MLEQYELLAFTLRPLHWRSRGRFLGAGEALLEIRAERGFEARVDELPLLI